MITLMVWFLALRLAPTYPHASSPASPLPPSLTPFPTVPKIQPVIHARRLSNCLFISFMIFCHVRPVILARDWGRMQTPADVYWMSKATGRLIDFDPFSVMSECDLLPHQGNLKKLFSPPVEIRTITLRRKAITRGIKINGHFRKPARNYEDIFLDTFKIEKGRSQTAIINRFWAKLWRKVHSSM